jgi:hypothetical protein
MASLAGVGMDEVESILRMLGFRSQKSDDGTTFTATPKALGKPKPERRRKRKQGGAKPPAAASSSPFAILQGVVGR